MHTSHVFREAARCIRGGTFPFGMWRRFHYAPLSLWVRHPKRAALFVAVRPYTMLPYVRLSQLYALADQCNQERILGDFVQCGVWRGGSGAILASVGYPARCVWLFDSFRGCPQPDVEDVSREGRRGKVGEAAAFVSDVLTLFDALGFEHGFIIRSGWFAQTLPKAKGSIGKIVILHLDCDWYASVKTCLEELYPNVVTGGYVVVDDFGYWPATQKAVGDYFVKRDEPMPAVHWVDHTGAWWKKP